ncbi:MAG: FKBP-type peptidyl-prolyl cis-trans isomerase [Bacteroidaceae bacterium]|nr:FKBP-type peptidyl-prolyl cis-trans isomerase [Bacteroidaceae bacterium]
MNKIIVTTYKLESFDRDGAPTMVEEATPEHPFKFISGMGFALDAFEQRVEPLAEGDTFDFTLDPEEAYGPYDEAHVIDFPKDAFCVDGRFDAAQIRPGANVPLVNEDGQHFVGHVLEVGDEQVRIDLNDTLAGKRIRFTGRVIISRPATNQEIAAFVNLLEDDGCGCGCHDHNDGHCCHHDHKDGHHCNHDHGHGHKDGHCCRHRHDK